MSAAGVKPFTESGQSPETMPFLDLKKILVPTDFSKNAEKALIYAVRLALRNNSSLILFHVFELPEFVRQLPPDFSYDSNEDTKKQLDTAKQRCAEKLETVARNVRKNNMKIETLQRLGVPYEEIVDVATELAVDLIVIATHGYTALKHFLLGSTTERVVRLAPCPVLVVREGERDFVP